MFSLKPIWFVCGFESLDNNFRQIFWGFFLNLWRLQGHKLFLNVVWIFTKPHGRSEPYTWEKYCKLLFIFSLCDTSTCHMLKWLLWNQYVSILIFHVFTKICPYIVENWGFWLAWSLMIGLELLCNCQIAPLPNCSVGYWYRNRGALLSMCRFLWSFRV